MMMDMQGCMNMMISKFLFYTWDDSADDVKFPIFTLSTKCKKLMHNMMNKLKQLAHLHLVTVDLWS
jgi:hypothetical protein